jgi:WD40 repeat protein
VWDAESGQALATLTGHQGDVGTAAFSPDGNEHAVLRIVGNKRWSVAHFLRTIQYLSNTAFASWQLDATVRVVKDLRRRKEQNYFLFADYPAVTKKSPTPRQLR